MNIEDRKQMLAAAEHIRRCDEADARRASTQSQEPPPFETLGVLIFAIERLFKEATDWHKSCSSTANWFDHSPAAQALKALLAQEPPAQEPPAQEPPAQEPPAQEPRLTLGRVPAGGEGYYVVYLSENKTELAIALSYYRDSEHRFPSWSPFHIEQECIMASFGPVPGHELVAAEWHAAGRPT